MNKSLLGSLINNVPKYMTPAAPVQKWSMSSIYGGIKFSQRQIDAALQPPPVTAITEPDCEMELTAVPKKRVSYTRNRKRNSAKKHENIHHHTVCPKCQSLKLRHHLCINCIRKI
ncbi:hypothetical protein PPL_09129 [Heterostelium album PN500]|uniref:Large ribosomal subunit protein bL32m n=1 Tax=Heterostelium pallidum (strain ATCC 26659 / Pp 5 / PN500) TaxID=670386 RepID=D3BKP7_HETP5|nr:hypothetical protein PPL_09129 [Heterostelium album PN500]EFA78477.1 hypothetical protein PPL_09129 [Heterostelium album PN500]|eukprot:XP_020430601.1 hypothetical protein PPL_09129 [Heterostelium album PN500]